MKEFHQVFKVIVDEEVRNHVATICEKNPKDVTEDDVQAAFNMVSLGELATISSEGVIEANSSVKLEFPNKSYSRILLTFPEGGGTELGVYDVIKRAVPSLAIHEVSKGTLWTVKLDMSKGIAGVKITNKSMTHGISYRVYNMPFIFK